RPLLGSILVDLQTQILDGADALADLADFLRDCGEPLRDGLKMPYDSARIEQRQRSQQPRAGLFDLEKYLLHHCVPSLIGVVSEVNPKDSMTLSIVLK